jgi:hypothetical protein
MSLSTEVFAVPTTNTEASNTTTTIRSSTTSEQPTQPANPLRYSSTCPPVASQLLCVMYHRRSLWMLFTIPTSQIRNVSGNRKSHTLVLSPALGIRRTFCLRIRFLTSTLSSTELTPALRTVITTTRTRTTTLTRVCCLQHLAHCGISPAGMSRTRTVSPRLHPDFPYHRLGQVTPPGILLLAPAMVATVTTLHSLVETALVQTLQVVRGGGSAYDVIKSTVVETIAYLSNVVAYEQKQPVVDTPTYSVSASGGWNNTAVLKGYQRQLGRTNLQICRHRLGPKSIWVRRHGRVLLHVDLDRISIRCVLS